MHTGTPECEALWFHTPPLLNGTQIFPIFGNINHVKPFRRSMQYNNLGIAIASAVVERSNNPTLDENMRDRILEPLGMARTTFGASVSMSNNAAKTYVAFEGGALYPFTRNAAG